MDQENVSPALGKIASGLFIATATEDGGAPIGMLCSFIEQAGFEPPMITLAVAPDRRLAKALEAGSKLGIHVLGKTKGGALMKPFVNSGNENPFAGLALTDNRHSIPQLADALAFLVCELRDCMAAGDHTIYLCEVIDGALQASEKGEEPMIRIRANGFAY